MADGSYLIISLHVLVSPYKNFDTFVHLSPNPQTLPLSNLTTTDCHRPDKIATDQIKYLILCLDFPVRNQHSKLETSTLRAIFIHMHSDQDSCVVSMWLISISIQEYKNYLYHHDQCAPNSCTTPTPFKIQDPGIFNEGFFRRMR